MQTYNVILSGPGGSCGHEHHGIGAAVTCLNQQTCNEPAVGRQDGRPLSNLELCEVLKHMISEGPLS